MCTQTSTVRSLRLVEFRIIKSNSCGLPGKTRRRSKRLAVLLQQSAKKCRPVYRTPGTSAVLPRFQSSPMTMRLCRYKSVVSCSRCGVVSRLVKATQADTLLKSAQVSRSRLCAASPVFTSMFSLSPVCSSRILVLLRVTNKRRI